MGMRKKSWSFLALFRRGKVVVAKNCPQRAKISVIWSGKSLGAKKKNAAGVVQWSFS
jgi:hypothetical protein